MKKAFRIRWKKVVENYSSIQYLIDGEYYNIAVNRAYYAMFCAAQALLILHDVHVKTHHGLQLKFGEHYIKTGFFTAELAEMLSQNEALRVKADYDFEDVATREQAERALDNATRFIKAIEAYCAKENLFND